MHAVYVAVTTESMQAWRLCTAHSLSYWTRNQSARVWLCLLQPIDGPVVREIGHMFA